MDYFPLFARLEGLPCLVVGGGTVAARKTKQLLRAGAAITINAPELNAELEALAGSGTVAAIRADFSSQRVQQQRLVIAATDDPDVNRQVAAAAEAHGIFCNVVDDRANSSVIIPALVDRSPLVVAVSSGGASPLLATNIRQSLEEQLPPNLGSLTQFLDAWRPVVKDKFPSLDERRRFWQEIIDGDVARLLLDGQDAAAAELMQQRLDGAQPLEGIAFIVGAGPGDPELLTLKAARALQSADVIVHDRLVGPAILEMARKDAEFISVGKQAGKPSIRQTKINELLISLVQSGKRVCRLKGGDPFVFGRGGEEIEALEAAGLAWQVIPGVTAANGCAAAVGIPLTHRDLARSLVIATAHTTDSAGPDWALLARAGDTLVAYMAVSTLADVCAQIMAGGRSAETPAVLIENGTTAGQRSQSGTLATLPGLALAAGIASPALLIVGEVAGLPTASGTRTGASQHDWLPPAAARATH